MVERLKELIFKEKMSGPELFHDISKDADEISKKEYKIQILINYGIWLYNFYKRPLKTSDFNVECRISRTCIEKLFGPIDNFFAVCSIPDKPIFTLNISGHQLFEYISRNLPENEKNERKKELLIEYAKWLYLKLNRPLQSEDFNEQRVSRKCIEKFFGTLTEFFKICEIPTIRRKRKMSNDEYKQYLIDKKIDVNGCWICKDFKNNQIAYKNKTWSMHRFSYTIFKGEIPTNLVIRHTCNNSDCFNPDHLIVGTQKDNIQDCIKSGRRNPVINKLKRNRARGGKISDLSESELINYVKSNCTITDKNEWLWNGSITEKGYARIVYKSRTYMLHKLMLSFKLKKPYDSIEIARHISIDGNSPKKFDVNPDHLEEGNPQQNSIDALLYSKSVKISKEQIKYIKEAVNLFKFDYLGAKKDFDEKMSIELNITPEMVRDVRLSKRWNHI